MDGQWFRETLYSVRTINYVAIIWRDHCIQQLWRILGKRRIVCLAHSLGRLCSSAVKRWREKERRREVKTKRQQEKRLDVWSRARPTRKEGRKSSTCFRHPAISWIVTAAARHPCNFSLYLIEIILAPCGKERERENSLSLFLAL